MRKIFLAITLCVLLAQAKASVDTVIVHKDPRLDVLTRKQIVLNKRAAILTSGGQYKGYRIQVISVTNKDQAFQIKGDLLARFPEEKSYVLYQSPYFKVRIGNFLKREDANKFRKDFLAKLFPQGVFIVEDVIEYTPPADEDDATNN